MALTTYELAQIQMLSEEQQLIVLTAERILDGETSPELTLLQVKYSQEIKDYIWKREMKAQFRPRI